MPLNHDEIIKALCAKAVNVEVTSKKYEAPKRVKRPSMSSTSSMSVASRPETNLQSVFAKLCAKANDVEVASKVSAASDQFGKLGRRASNSRTNSTKVVASLCAKASSLPLDGNNSNNQMEPLAEISKDETSMSNASEESSKEPSSNSKTMESSSMTSSGNDDANAMTPDEFNELAKCLVTVPSGGNVVEVCTSSNSLSHSSSHHHNAPPQVVMATKSNSCDASITSDVTDWDFGSSVTSSSRGGSSSSSTYDADKVVENVYRMAAADPALARRIAMAANSTKFLELNGSGSFSMQEENGLVDTMFPVSFSKLSTVREHKEPKMPKLTPLARELVQHPSSSKAASSSSAPPKILKKKRSKSTTRERPPPLISADPSSLVVTNSKPIKSKRDPSHRTKVDVMSTDGSNSSSPFYFVQDNPRTHR